MFPCGLTIPNNHRLQKQNIPIIQNLSMKGAVVQDVKVQQESCECCKVLLLSAEIKCTRDLNGWVLKVIEWCINLCKFLAHKGISSRQIIPLLRFLKRSVTKKIIIKSRIT